MHNVLEIKNLTMDFGGLRAVNNLYLNTRQKKITSLIGPNGAGKTTIFNCITGVYSPSGGEILIKSCGFPAINNCKLAN